MFPAMIDMKNCINKMLGTILSAALLIVFFGCVSNCLAEDACIGEPSTTSRSETVYGAEHEEDSCPVNVSICSTAPERAGFSAAFAALNPVSSLKPFLPRKVERINSVRAGYSQLSHTSHRKLPFRVLRI